MKRIVIAGGSGFIGTALAQELISRGHEVTILTRSPKIRQDAVGEVAWDGKNSGHWVQSLDEAAAIINLAGKNINCPHTPENLRELTASRVDAVKVLAAAMTEIKSPPRIWVQASATGFYGDSKSMLRDETSPNGDDALAGICRAWENAFAGVHAPAGMRKVVLRIGFVLGRNGGALPVLARLAKLFLGGAAGDGKQFISWIHLADLTRMFIEAIEREDLSGAFNAVAPQPVINAEFMRELRRALHRPWSPPVPEFAVRLGARLMHSEPTLALTGQRCAPKRFGEVGFNFQFSGLRAALKNLFPD